MSDQEIVNELRKIRKQNDEIIRQLESIDGTVGYLVASGRDEGTVTPPRPAPDTKLKTSRDW